MVYAFINTLRNETNSFSFLSADCKNVCCGVSGGFNWCLAGESSGSWILPQSLTPSYYSYLRLKGPINCLCAPLNVTISAERQASFGFIFFFYCFFYALEAQKKRTTCNIAASFSQDPIKELTSKEFGGRIRDAHPPVIASIKLKRTAGFITAPGWEIVYYFSALQCAFYPVPPTWFIGQNVCITTPGASKRTLPIYNRVDKFLLFVVINQRWL